MRETNYWLRILKEIESTHVNIEIILKESLELMRILGSISSKSLKRNE